MLKTPFFSWEELEWIKVDENTRRKQVWFGRLMHVLVELKAGSVSPVHNHPHEQIGYIMQGSLEVKVGDNVRVLKAGEGYLVPFQCEAWCDRARQSGCIDTGYIYSHPGGFSINHSPHI